MPKRLLVHILTLVASVWSAFAEPAWEIISPKPIIGDIQNIDFPTADSGWVISAAGLLARTYDRGRTWQEISLPDSSTGPWRMDALDGQHIWVLGGFDFIQHGMTRLYTTSDGGENWRMTPLGDLEDPFGGTTLYVTDTNNVWVGGSGAGQGGTQPTLWRWRNSWERFLLPVRRMPDLTDLCFIGNIGWAVGTVGYIAHTSNGGLDWDTLNSDTEMSLNAVIFDSPANGWIGGGNFINGLILKTTNGGGNWQRIETPATSEVNDLKYWSNNRLMMVTEGGENPAQIIISYDGREWQTVYELQTVHMRSLSVSGGEFWVGGSNGLILHSSDGVHWQEMSRRLIDDAACIQFLDDQRGWCVGSNSYLLKTTNGGGFWTRCAIREDVSFYSVFFLDDNRGFVGGVGSLEFITEDGGRSWSGIEIGENEISRIAFRGDAGFALNGGSVSVSRDRGANWQSVQVARPGALLTGLSVVSADVAYVCSPNDSVRWTEDGGASWWRLAAPFGNCLDLHFIDARYGWAAAIEGGNQRIYTTEDGGVNWTARALIRFRLIGLRFADARNGWLWGAGGEFMQTTDGGSRWTNVSLRCKNMIRDMHIFNSGRLWICGEGSLMARFGENWTSAPPQPEFAPVTPCLVSVWPNPTNGFVNLKFNRSIFASSLGLFDGQGRQVADFAISAAPADHSQMMVSLFGLPSGSYYFLLLPNRNGISAPVSLIK